MTASKPPDEGTPITQKLRDKDYNASSTESMDLLLVDILESHEDLERELQAERQRCEGWVNSYAGWVVKMVAAGYKSFGHFDEPLDAIIAERDALKQHAEQAESRAASAEKDARRYRLCQQEGFPVRNQSPADENKRWTIQGKWYGATPSLCIDAASGEAG